MYKAPLHLPEQALSAALRYSFNQCVFHREIQEIGPVHQSGGWVNVERGAEASHCRFQMPESRFVGRSDKVETQRQAGRAKGMNGLDHFPLMLVGVDDRDIQQLERLFLAVLGDRPLWSWLHQEATVEPMRYCDSDRATGPDNRTDDALGVLS